MLATFEGNSANDVWGQAVCRLRAIGLRQPSRGGQTREILHAALSISNPRQRWVQSRSPAINTAFAIAEIIWIIRGRNDRRFLSYWNRSLSKFVGNAHFLHGAYGHRLVHHFGFDQLVRAAKILDSSPDSRQLVLQIWDPTTDMPFGSGREQSKDIPCNVLSMLKVRRGRLEWMQIMRSNDLFRGLPYNLVQFTSLQEIIAGWLAIAPGTFNQLSDSLHVYETDLQNFRIQKRPDPPNTDSLALPRAQSNMTFSSLDKFADDLIDGMPKRELASRIRTRNLPTAYHNFLLILAAEHCRKRSWRDLSEEAIQGCSNPALVTSWRNWEARCSNKISS